MPNIDIYSDPDCLYLKSSQKSFSWNANFREGELQFLIRLEREGQANKEGVTHTLSHVRRGSVKSGLPF